MNKVSLFFLLLFSLATAVVKSQPFNTGRQVINFVDPSRANRQISTEVYYPALSNGNNVPIATGIDKFPLVVFGHGFVIPVSSYGWLKDSLVKFGYIVAMPTTEGNLFPSHENFGKDLAFLCAAIIALDNNNSSIFYQHVKNRSAVAGHSMGGGASFLAASGNSVANVVFNFAAAETNPSATAAASLTSKPALVFSGSSDCIVAPSVQQSMYANVNNSCKTYININDALHCQFANNNGTCAFGQLTSGCNSSSISASLVFNKVTYMLLPFLDYYLKDICLRGTDFLNAYATIAGVTKQSNCTGFPVCGVLPVNLLGFYGTVRNKKPLLTWNVSSEFNLRSYLVERSNNGINFKAFAPELPAGKTTYKLSDPYPYPGLSYYRIKMIDNDGSFRYSDVVKIHIKGYGVAITGCYPNPVKDHINIELFAEKNEMVCVSLINLQGQISFNKYIPLPNGTTMDKILLNKLPAGSYLLRLTGEDGQLLSSLTLVKQ